MVPSARLPSGSSKETSLGPLARFRTNAGVIGIPLTTCGGFGAARMRVEPRPFVNRPPAVCRCEKVYSPVWPSVGLPFCCPDRRSHGCPHPCTSSPTRHPLEAGAGPLGGAGASWGVRGLTFWEPLHHQTLRKVVNERMRRKCHENHYAMRGGYPSFRPAGFSGVKFYSGRCLIRAV